MRRFELRPSPRLAVLLALAHAAAAWSAYLSVPGWAGPGLALALLALGATAIWSRALLRAAGSVRVLEIGPARTAVQLAGGESCEVELAERRYVTRWLVALPVSRPAKRTILITADMLPAETFRILRLWALWGRFPASTEQGAGGAAAVH
ncbi:MAG TPA: protein YgfX [Burkholderiales bacterium]|nr:protein YgfX [Burkholderiales bacterium]